MAHPSSLLPPPQNVSDVDLRTCPRVTWVPYRDEILIDYFDFDETGASALLTDTSNNQPELRSAIISRITEYVFQKDEEFGSFYPSQKKLLETSTRLHVRR